MPKKRLLLLSVFSLLITCFSPFIFSAYFENKPISLTQTSKFGGPFPFAEQTVVLPKEKAKYPLEIDFTSPFEHKTKFLPIPFLLSCLCFFMLSLALTTIILRFFRGKHEPH